MLVVEGCHLEEANSQSKVWCSCIVLVDNFNIILGVTLGPVSNTVASVNSSPKGPNSKLNICDFAVDVSSALDTPFPTCPSFPAPRFPALPPQCMLLCV